MNKLKAHIKTTILISWFALMVFIWSKLALFADTFINGADIWVATAPLVILLYVFLYFLLKEQPNETK